MFAYCYRLHFALVCAVLTDVFDASFFNDLNFFYVSVSA